MAQAYSPKRSRHCSTSVSEYPAAKPTRVRPVAPKATETIIEACSVRHRIRFSADAVRQVPKAEHSQEASNVKNGTSATVPWPASACSILDSARTQFLQIAEDYAWLNPHLSLSIIWNGEQRD